MTKLFGKSGTLKTWLLVAAAFVTSTCVAAPLPVQAQSTQTTSPDSNPGTAWSIRENYFKRYKWAEEFYRSDVVTNGESQGPGTVTPSSGPVYKWPATVEQGQPSQVPTRRDEAIQKFQVKTFGYPVSDTQFQTIQRLNDNMMLEEAFDPERWMWMENAVGAIKATSAANSLANLERNQATSAINLTRMFLDNFTVDPGNVWNRIRNELFIPMAFLLLLPGAVLSQVRAIIAQGNPVLGPVNPFDGILRSIVAVFLIPSTYLVVNYSIDFANSVTYEIQQGYTRISGGGDMYQDAVSGHNRAFPIRDPNSNRNAIPPAPTTNNNPQGQGDPISTLESISFDVGADSGDPNKADEVSPVLKSTQRALVNGANGGLAGTWNVLCAFQMAYLYYLFCIGPVVAALWVWPMGQLRGAFSSWVEGVITLCFWSLFWNTTVLLMACFRTSGETGTVVMSALNFLSIASVRHAFDFAGLVKAAGDKVGQEIKKGQSGGGKSGGGKGADKGADTTGGSATGGDSKGGSSTADGGGSSSTSGGGGSSTSSATSNSTSTSNFLGSSASNGLSMAALGVDAGLPPTSSDSNPGALNLPGADVKGGSVEVASPPLSSGSALSAIGGSDHGQGAQALAHKAGDQNANAELRNLAGDQKLFGNDVSHLTQDMPLVGPDLGASNGSFASSMAPGAIGLPPGADSFGTTSNGFAGTPGADANAFGGNLNSIGGGPDKFATLPGSTTAESMNHPFFTNNAGVDPAGATAHGATNASAHTLGEGGPGKGGTAFDALTGAATPFASNEGARSINSQDAQAGGMVVGVGENAARGLSNLIESAGNNGPALTNQSGSTVPGSQDSAVITNGFNNANGSSAVDNATFVPQTSANATHIGTTDNGSFVTGQNANSSFSTSDAAAFVGGVAVGATIANGGGSEGSQPNATFNGGNGVSSEAVAFVGGVAMGSMMSGGNGGGAENAVSQGQSYVSGTQTYTQGDAGSPSTQGSSSIGTQNATSSYVGGQSSQGQGSTVGGESPNAIGGHNSMPAMSEAAAFVGGLAVGSLMSGGNGGEQGVGGQANYSAPQVQYDGAQGSPTSTNSIGSQGTDSNSFSFNPTQSIENAAAFVGGMAVGSLMSGGNSEGTSNSVSTSSFSAPDASGAGQPASSGSFGGDSGSSTSFGPGSIENAASFVGGMVVGAMMSGGSDSGTTSTSSSSGFSADAAQGQSAPQGGASEPQQSFSPLQSIENAAAFVGGMAVGAMMSGDSGSTPSSSSSSYTQDSSTYTAPAASGSSYTPDYSGGYSTPTSNASYGWSDYTASASGYSVPAQGYSTPSPSYSEPQPVYSAPQPAPVNNDAPPAPAPAPHFEPAQPSYQPAPASYEPAPASYAASYAPTYAASYDASQQQAYVAQPQQQHAVPQQHEPVQHQPMQQYHAQPEPQAPQHMPVAYDPSAAAQAYTAASYTAPAPEASYAPGGQYHQVAEASHAVRHDYQSGPQAAASHHHSMDGGHAPAPSGPAPATSSHPAGHGGAAAHGPEGHTESVIMHNTNGQRDAAQDDHHNNQNALGHGNDPNSPWNQGDNHDQQGPLGSLFGAAAALRRNQQNGRGSDKAGASALLSALGKAATNKPTGSQQLPAAAQQGNKPNASASLQAQLQPRAPQQKKDQEREDELDEELVRIEEQAKSQNWA